VQRGRLGCVRAQTLSNFFLPKPQTSTAHLNAQVILAEGQKLLPARELSAAAIVIRLKKATFAPHLPCQKC
jgi:hypothetical protein